MTYYRRRGGFRISTFIKVLALVLVLVGILYGVSQCGDGSCACVRKIDKTEPPADRYPWLVETPTHVYCAKAVDEDDTIVVLHDWYEYREHWVYQGERLELQKSMYRYIDIGLRE